MPLVYFDASAFVKLLAEEPASDLAAELRDGCDAAVSSRLAYPEVRAAAARNHDLTADDLDEAEQQWSGYWAATRPVELSAAVEQHAGELARAHSLRVAGAVHLASALAMGDTDLVIAVWDRRLHDGAHAAGLRTAPARLSLQARGTDQPRMQDPISWPGRCQAASHVPVQVAQDAEFGAMMKLFVELVAAQVRPCRPRRKDVGVRAVLCAGTFVDP
jgi:predicted nucleic acid-binding protein